MLKILFVCIILMAVSCKEANVAENIKEESLSAKELLQGIWLDEDETVNMKVKGDTIYFADTLMSPVYFQILDDSLVLKGAREMRYAIVRQSPNIFHFTNHMGDVVKLSKSIHAEDAQIFERKVAVQLNQNQLIKRDTILVEGQRRYHVYVQVNPSTYKVVRTSYNQDGVMVDNIYYDNIVNVCVYDGGNRIFFRDMYKKDFQKFIPSDYFGQSVLSDINITEISSEGIKLQAYICVPDSPTSYVVNILITESGEMKMSVG